MLFVFPDGPQHRSSLRLAPLVVGGVLFALFEFFPFFLLGFLALPAGLEDRTVQVTRRKKTHPRRGYELVGSVS